MCQKGSGASYLLGRFYLLGVLSVEGFSFFTPDKPGVPISTTSSEPATYAIFAPRRRLPRRVPCTIGKVGVGQTIAAARTLTVAHKGPPGD